MNDREEVKQRVQYLIEHGGIYPEDRKPWPKWVWLLVAIGVAGVVLELLGYRM